MADIHKITVNGETVLPATTTDAVVHPQTEVSLTSLIGEYNLSTLFPTSGTDGGKKYTIDSAVALISTKLVEAQRNKGTKILFENADGNIEIWIYTTGSEFSVVAGWTQFDTNIISDLIKRIEELEKK